MPDHREAAAALHADVGGTLPPSHWPSASYVSFPARMGLPSAYVECSYASLSVRVYGADHALARAILRLVVAARERATQTGGGT